MENKNKKEVKKYMKQKNITKKYFAVVLASMLLFGLVGSTFVTAEKFGVNSDINSKTSLNSRNNAGFGIHADLKIQEKDRERIRDPSEISDELKKQGSFETDDEFLVKERMDSIEAHPGLVASGFAKVDHGTGWAISSDGTGSLLKILLVQRTFVNATDNSSEEIVLSKGVFKLSGSSALGLNLISNSGSDFSYEVVNKGETVGTLTLVENSYASGFSTWSGELNLESGENYDVTFATLNSKTKAETNGKDGSSNFNSNPNAGGLWGRMKSLFNSKGK